jgi:carbon monoxide dehydrogenase subunit G
MQFSGEYEIPAPPERVWFYLNNEATLASCLPGVQELYRTSDTSFSFKIDATIGPISSLFSSHFETFDLDPPHSYGIKGEGDGGAAGFAGGEAKFELQECEVGTLLCYKVSAELSGELAEISPDIVSTSARKFTDDFFAALTRKIQSGEAEAQEQRQQASNLAQVLDHGETTIEEQDMTGENQKHSSPAGGIIAEPVEVDDSDIGAGTELGVWVTALLCIVLVLLAIFAL